MDRDINEEIEQYKINFSMVFLILPEYIVLGLLETQLLLCFTLQVLIYILWLKIFPFVYLLYKKYPLFLIISVSSFVSFSALGRQLLTEEYRYFADLIMLLGIISFSVTYFYYCSARRLAEVGWNIVEFYED